MAAAVLLLRHWRHQRMRLPIPLITIAPDQLLAPPTIHPRRHQIPLPPPPLLPLLPPLPCPVPLRRRSRIPRVHHLRLPVLNRQHETRSCTTTFVNGSRRCIASGTHHPPAVNAHHHGRVMMVCNGTCVRAGVVLDTYVHTRQCAMLFY
jgi:hypothetical protein